MAGPGEGWLDTRVPWTGRKLVRMLGRGQGEAGVFSGSLHPQLRQRAGGGPHGVPGSPHPLGLLWPPALQPEL